MSDYEGGTASLERASDLEKDPKGTVKRWLLELKLADKRESDWRKKAEKVWAKYRQKENKKTGAFNILWANTETLRPAVYNTLPKPDVRRRFKDEDKMGKAVSDVLTRSLEYGLDVTDFDFHIKTACLDMLLPGRAVCRVRYVPSFNQVSEEGLEPDDSFESEQNEELAWEQAPIEHVQWDDFRISAGKEWGEVTWIAFRHRLTRDELVEQFGKIGEQVNLDSTDDEDVKQEKDERVQDSFKTAEVWEIWDKEKSRVLFISQGYKESPLEAVDDPLGLQGFYPIPRPLYAIEDSSSLVPVALYELYREQGEELDRISGRINVIVKGLKLRGIYDSTLSELSELMRGEDNDLIPAQNATALLERGGIEKAIWMWPVETAAMVLKELYVQRDQCKAVIYEITGISDILRGSTNANETATAQNIKNQWGTNRLKRMQAEVQRFIRDLIRIQAEIISEKFQPETLMEMTGIKMPSLQEKQQAMMQYQQQAMMAQQQGQQPPPPPPEVPCWEEVIQVMRDDKQRTYKVDIETDSTIAASVEQDMQSLQQVSQAMGVTLKEWMPLVQMNALPLEALKELLLTIARRAKFGNALEDALDKMQQPPPPPQEQQQPDNSLQVEQMRQQGQQQIKQAEMQHQQQLEQSRQQLEAAKLQAQQQLEVMRAELEKAKAEQQAMVEGQKMEFDRWKAQLDAETKIVVAELQAKTSLQTSAMSASTDEVEVGEDGARKPAAGISALVEAVNSNLEALINTQTEHNAKVIEAVTRPRKAIRGPDGRIAGVQ